MGQAVHHRKLIILIICIGLAGIPIYCRPPSKAVNKPIPLAQALADIKGWTTGKPVPLELTIVDALELDDYVNQNYFNEDERVFLYVGYYLTTKKLGAVHSPLVCFPGQGWAISSKDNRTIRIGEDDINLVIMILSRDQERELVLYWFQAFDRTSPGTLLQKAYALWSKLVHSREDNAFVRVTIPMREQAPEKAFSTGIAFIEAFYPPFLKYVIGT